MLIRESFIVLGEFILADPMKCFNYIAHILGC